MADTIPPRRILAAIDFDATAEAALAHASAWARGFDAPLTVLHARPPAAAREPDERDARAELDAFVQANVPGDLPMPERLVAEGGPLDTIPAAAGRIGADLIVMGSHGRGLLGRVVLGSVAAGVVSRAGRPVLLVREPGPFLTGGIVLVAVDLGDTSEEAVADAGRLAQAAGASVRLLHVLPIGDHESPGHVVMRETATRALEELCARHVPPGVATEVHVAMRMEEPARAVAHDAREHGARLLVVGGHGTSRWANLLLGNITQHVLHDTPLPVLVVPARTAKD